MASERARVLVIRGGAIGDFILTLPVLAALRERFPNVHLEVLGYPHIAGLALAGGLVHGVRPIEARGLAGFFVPGGDLDPDLMAYFGGFALIISYLYDPDWFLRTNIARCGKAQFIAGPHRPPEGTGRHATASLLEPLERLTIFDADPVPRLRFEGGESGSQPAAGGEASGAAANAPWLAAHPGSGSEKKNWSEENWASLLAGLAQETDWNLLLVGWEAEGGRLERLARGWPESRLELERSRPLVDLARRLQRCSWFIGHDSGITHLAAALGRPALVLWGGTDQATWRPLGDSVRLLEAQAGLPSLPVEQVHRALLGLAATYKHA